MKSIYDPSVREELIRRIQALENTSKAQWGMMSVYQMAKHCRLWEEMLLGKKVYPRAFLGFLFGKLALKTVLKDDAPLRRNTPTLATLKIQEEGDLALEKAKWMALVQEHGHIFNPDFVHPFFGKMTKEQMGEVAYKHSDHHLRQFGC